MNPVTAANFLSKSGLDSEPLPFMDENSAREEDYTKLVWEFFRTWARHHAVRREMGFSYDMTIIEHEKFADFLHLGAEEKEKDFIVALLNNPSPDHQIKQIAEDLKYLGYSNCAEDICWFHDDNDLEEGEQPLNPESAKGFLSFITQFGDLGEPMLGPFPEGTLSVEWRIADNKHLLVEPLDSKNACFALIGPSDSLDSPDGKFRLNGRGTIKDVIKTLRKYEVDRWKQG